MHDASRSSSAVEIFPPDWHFPAGASWVAGWISLTDGDAATDVRLWLDERPWLGLHGLPRPGLNLPGPGSVVPPYPGFSFLVTPHRGAKWLRIEVRNLAGAWSDFFQVAISVAPSAEPEPRLSALADRLPTLIPSLIRHAHRQPARPITGLAREVLAASLAEPLNSLPNLPFVGALEEPASSGRVRHGRLSVTGWLAHQSARIVRLTAMVDPQQEVVLPHGIARTDLAENFCNENGAGAFVGRVDLPAGLNAPVLLKIFAELEDGSRHLAFAQRFSPQIPVGTRPVTPTVSGLRFARAVWGLAQAARRLGVPTAGIVGAARSAWAGYPGRSHRPSAVAPPLQRVRPLRILVATHNLNFEGAPRLVLELASFLARQPDVTVRVVSPQDGPLRNLCEAAGMEVTVLDLTPAFAAASAPEFHAAIDRVGRQIDWAATDLVLANTVVSFWAVHLAQRAQKPSLFYVHESAPVARLFAPLVCSALFPEVEAALELATRVAFTADASRQIFAEHDRGHFRVLPSWLDLAAIDAFATANSAATLRAKHGLAPNSVVLLNLGTVCERKGQHTFVRAAELLASELGRKHSGRQIEFVLVGARDDEFLASLREQIAAAGLQRVRIVAETRENFDWHRLADILVCTSFEESSPRVLLEAAAFGTPIVSTDVNGIPELLAGDAAWLVEPGDAYHLADALRGAIAAHFAGDTSRSARARRSVARRFDERISLPRHLALAMETVATYS